MFPISQGFVGVENRLNALINDGPHDAALLASVFAMEKTIRRALRFCALNRGFTSKQCDRIFNNMGFEAMKEAWPNYERYYRTLPECVGENYWPHVAKAVKMRNAIVHGSRVYYLSDCRDKALRVKNAIEVLRNTAMQDLGCDPWNRLPGKKTPSLVWLDLKQSLVVSK